MEHCCVVRKTSVTELQIFIFLRYNTAVLTISVVSPPVDHTQLYFLRLPVVFVYDFTSSLSPLTSSPSSTSRRLCRLCLRHHLVAGFSFPLHVGNSSWIVAGFSFPLHAGNSSW
ncbi:Uncharacterized protein APZ42_017105, partial [Daphnia magna]